MFIKQPTDKMRQANPHITVAKSEDKIKIRLKPVRKLKNTKVDFVVVVSSISLEEMDPISEKRSQNVLEKIGLNSVVKD